MTSLKYVGGSSSSISFWKPNWKQDQPSISSLTPIVATAAATGITNGEACRARPCASVGLRADQHDSFRTAMFLSCWTCS